MTLTIGEVSKKTNLSVPTLRYYDREGLFPGLQRESGIRKFSDKELAGIQVIECLKKSGLSIPDIKQFMDWTTMGSETFEERKDLFVNQRAQVEKQLNDLKRVDNLLRYKCWYYEMAMKLGSEEAVKAIPFDKLPKQIQENFPYEH
ncbi:hypothetical protein FFRU_040550 [Fructobacillus fructosus]|uniref:MerR family transcriptional regulator n=1 Tax=Fructobacillus fructosus TaxID=1631 RepID=UPI000219497A|nr:MerR family transcriptional regulator [Fructobacillus fructosus]KRN52802.1 MerR family transcriptional regulator [Fructobacillus fructosus KCTC 3544]GAP01121.1 hypothetical protein FFRU_040550 [Fructobacillus fructosus]